MAIAEGLSYIFIQLIIHKVQRRKATAIGIFISSTMCSLISLSNYFNFQTENKYHTFIIYFQGISLLINRFVLSSTWALVFVYLSEIFPTSVRNLGLGCNSAVGTAGSALAPYFINFSKIVKIDSWIIPSLFGFLGFLSVYYLP